MDSKTFKEMIKKHQVKQLFILDAGISKFYRIYIDTFGPKTIWKVTWEVTLNNKVDKFIDRIDYVTFEGIKELYKQQCKHDLTEYIAFVQEQFDNCVMEQKKFWLTKLRGLLFSVNDKRVD